MIPVAFEYSRARTLAEAVKAAGTKNTALICGGQSLIPLLRFRLARPKRVVDISGIAQLKGIAKAKGGVRIGAATTWRELLESKFVARECPLIAEVVPHIGDVQVRNLGTIGGSIVHADPASDIAAAMLALGARLTLKSSRGARVVAAQDFYRGPFETAMKGGELLVEIQVPGPPKGSGAAYVSFDQAASGYPLVGAAAVITRDSEGKVASAVLAFTGLADAPFAAGAAALLVGTRGDDGMAAKVAAAAVAGVDANDDIHASAKYRLHLAVVAATRAITTASGRASGA